jgi:hypothetical protein
MIKSLSTILIVAVGFMFDTSVNNYSTTEINKRQTVETIQQAKGSIRIIDEAGVYMIHCPQKHLKLHVINLPEKFRKANAEIIFSGNIKATNVSEDNWGDYFELTAIE